MPAAIILIETTLEHREQADQLASQAVDARLAACAQVEGPVVSHYIWQGRRETIPEFRILFKVAEKNKDRLVEWLLEQHPYDCPQILSSRVQSDNPDYTAWVDDV